MYRPEPRRRCCAARSPPGPPDVEHYISHFRYPTRGRLRLLPAARSPTWPTSGSATRWCRSIRGAARCASPTAATYGYDGLVSSVPLPDLLPMIAGAPADVVAASRRLACSTCVLVNVGVDRADLSRAHMTYFYDEDICFTRLSFPHMLSASNVPAGMRQHPGRGLFLEQVPAVHRAARRLDRAGDRGSQTLRPASRRATESSARHASVVRYANVIFDLERAAAIEDGPRLPRRRRHRLLRPLRRLGLHVDRRELHQRRACGGVGALHSARLRVGKTGQMSEHKVVIGLPVYNGQKYLGAAIESHLSQSFGDFDLVISDNGSTDATPDNLRRLREQGQAGQVPPIGRESRNPLEPSAGARRDRESEPVLSLGRGRRHHGARTAAVDGDGAGHSARSRSRHARHEEHRRRR